MSTNPNPLKLAYAREYPGELAAYLATQGGQAIAQALDGLPAKHAAAIVARLPQGHAAHVLMRHDDERVARWLDAASLDDALALLLHMDEARRAVILDTLPDRRSRQALRRLLTYPAAKVGALVNPAATRLNAATPLAEAVSILRSDELGTEQAIWLVDEAGGYLGLLDLGRALVARSDRLQLGELLIPVRALRAETTLADAREFSEWIKYPELPVIDHLGHMLGTLSRGRLLSALGGGTSAEKGLIEILSELTQQYFRVMGICLGDLFRMRGPGR